MTDSTYYNKEIAKNLAEAFHRKEIAGQIFCDSRTTLGFDKGIAKTIHTMENKMGIQNIFSGFLLDFDIDQRKDSVSISAISLCLSLIEPENINKQCNYYKDFCTFLQRKDCTVHLFLLKDASFGALSNSSAIMYFHWDDFNVFLSSREYVTNKFACMVRDTLCLEYIKVVVAVIAVIGVQLIAPYHAITISNKSTNYFLKFYMKNYATIKLLKLSSILPHQPLNQCQTAESHMNDCITPAQIMLPHLEKFLRSQKGKYYGFGDIEEECPVFEHSGHYVTL